MTVPLSEGEVLQPTYTAGTYDYRGTAYAGNAEYGISKIFINQYGGYYIDKYTLSKVYNTEGYTDGTIIPDETNYRYGIRYNYYRRDHLGNNREVWTTEQVNYGGTIPAFTSQRTQYYPSGLPWAEGTGASVQNKKYNGKEFIEVHGLDEYDSQARMYYPAIMRTTTLDPLAEKYYSISPYAWCGNNPVNRVDLDGMLDDWIFNTETEEYVWDGNVTKRSETPTGYEYVGTSLKDVENHFKDNNPITSFFSNPKFGKDRTPWSGEILPADKLTSLEMWLETPSESIGVGIGKIGANIGYSIANSPYSLITGKTLGGTSLNSNEKMGAFVDFVPGLISGGITKTGQVIKTTSKGLQGYNQFLKGTKKIGIEFKGLNWQQNVGKAFQINKVNQQGLKDLDKTRNVLNIGNTTKNELKK